MTSEETLKSKLAFEKFADYAAKNYILDEDSSDATETEDSSGYFSDEELQVDEKGRGDG